MMHCLVPPMFSEIAKLAGGVHFLGENGMLRVMVHEDGKISRLELAGRLEGLWVAETEKAWHASLRPDRKIEVDLRQLTAIDSAGRELSSAMHLAGVRLVVGACG